MKSTIWLTGLPCSGKTTICKQLKHKIKGKVIHLDGDVVRNGLCSDLKFSPEDRKENLRRISHLCEILNKEGITVVASFVSPTKDARSIIKSIISNLKMIHVDCSIEKCVERDVKGMCAKAIDGKIPNFTGISAPFEIPENPDFIVNTELETVEESVSKIVDYLS